MALIHMNFNSKYLSGNTDVNILLPDCSGKQEPDAFYGSGKKYPVLWLLHGTFGDYSDWLRKSNVELYAAEKNLMVVMPSAQNADYANWPGFGIGYHAYDYLTEELMPLVYGWLPASDKREDNFIAGLSMGYILLGTSGKVCCSIQHVLGTAEYASDCRRTGKIRRRAALSERQAWEGEKPDPAAECGWAAGLSCFSV